LKFYLSLTHIKFLCHFHSFREYRYLACIYLSESTRKKRDAPLAVDSVTKRAVSKGGDEVRMPGRILN